MSRPRRKSGGASSRGSAAGSLTNGSISSDTVSTKLADPSSWSCEVCGTTANVWIRLGDGFVGCGGDEAGHLFPVRPLNAHYSSLAVALNTADHALLCVVSKASVEVDSLSPETTGAVSAVIDQLNTMQSLSLNCDDVTPVMRRWKRVRLAVKLFGLPFFSESSQRKRREDDKRVTVLAQWVHKDVLKAFRTWRNRVAAGECLVEIPAKPGLVPGRTGLKNLGNTCYMNSTLQALSNTPHLRHTLFQLIDKLDYRPVDVDSPSVPAKPSGHTSKRTKVEPMPDELSENCDDITQCGLTKGIASVLHRIWRKPQAQLSPDDFLKLSWNVFPQFSGFKQQDVDEYLRSVISRLEAEWESLGPSSPVSLLRNAIVTEVTCSQCGHTASSTESSVCPIALQIPTKFHSHPKSSSRSRRGDVCALNDCVTDTFQSESISGYDCVSCKSKQTARISKRMQQWPDVLIFQLIRTSWALGGKKIDASVDFPLNDLDLMHVTSPSATPGPRYSLCSLVEHHGKGLGEGHYTAMGKHSPTGTWLSFNDARVNIISEADVLACQAYILVYQRTPSL